MSDCEESRLTREPYRTKAMQTGLAVMLIGLMSFLVLGLVAISGAAVREAQLDPGVAPEPARIRRR